MKAYVIKNKERKYYQDDIRKFGELYLATFYKEEHFAIKDAIYLSPNFEWQKNYKVVEITIAEGELEQQLALYKRALELMATSYFGNKECIRFVNTGFQAESDVCLIEYFLDRAKEKLEKEIEDARKEVL